jgi:hypothetical protein
VKELKRLDRMSEEVLDSILMHKLEKAHPSLSCRKTLLFELIIN